MLTLLLVDAELERVPSSLTGHPQVATSARRVGASATRMLLDSSLHHAAMRKLPDGARRGRPDLVHFFLINALESPANRAGQLRLLVHTREDYLVRVEPRTRLVRNYNRFCGLIQQLFETGRVPPEDPLLTLEPSRTVADIVAQVRPDRVLVLDETGPVRPPWDVFTADDVARETLCIIGGFPSGTFRSALPEGERVSFGPEQLPVWTVAWELLANYERWLPWPPVRAPAATDPPPQAGDRRAR
jgi:rRNA small subunit pseudouridine methyltransferase Nep1